MQKGVAVSIHNKVGETTFETAIVASAATIEDLADKTYHIQPIISQHLEQWQMNFVRFGKRASSSSDPLEAAP